MVSSLASNDEFIETELGLLPPDWDLVDVCDKYTFTQKPRGLRYDRFATIPFVPMDLIPFHKIAFNSYLLKRPDEISSGTYFEAGDILLPKITPSFENGKQGIIPDLPNGFGAATTEVIPIKAIPQVSDSGFLFYYLLKDDVRTALAAKMEGSTGRQRLSRAVLESLRIPFPPLPEQRAIARVLSTIQLAIEAQDNLIAATHRLKQSLMRHLFTYGPVPPGEAERVTLRKTEIGELPEHWQVLTLADISSAFQYGTSRRAEKLAHGDPILRIPNVIDGRVNITDLKFVELPARTADRLRLNIGDLLFVRTNGRREYVGRSAVFQGELKDALFASYLIRVKIKANCALPEYVQLYCMTEMGQQFLSGRASNAADGKYNINTQILRRVLVPIPPIGEQQGIVDTLHVVERKIVVENQRRAALEALFKTMLKQLMTGQIRARHVEAVVA